MNRTWLVKSNGRILGPYSKAELDQMLTSKEIVVLDEVSAPFRRWRYIRDHEDFVDIVEEVRKLSFGSNEDHTFTTSNLGNQTITITEKIGGTQVTEKIDHLLDDHLTEEIVVSDIEEEVMIRGGGDPMSSGSSFVTEAISKQYEDQASDSASRLLWIMAILVVLGVGGFVFYKRTNPVEVTEEFSTQKYKEQGLEHYYAGDYSLSIPPLMKAYSAQPEDLELARLLAPVLVQGGADGFLQAEQMILTLKEHPRHKQKALVIEGLLFLKEGDNRSAEKVLTEAAEMDTFSWQAFTNLGVAAFNTQDFVSAKNHFDTALKIELKRSTSRGEAYLMRAQSELELWKEKSDDRYLKQAKSGINSYLNEYSDYRQEALLLRAFAEFAQNDFEAAGKTVDQIIDTDPFLTEEHAKDPSVYRDNLEWASLLEWCQAIVSGMNTSSHLETLHALCLVQSRDKEVEAREVINAAVNQAPKDPLVQSVYAFVNWHLGSDIKAEMLASRAIEMNNESEAKLPHIIKARICESLENYECSLEEWKKVRSKDELSISALAGLSVSYLNLKKFTQFESSFNTARKRARYYKPLLRAQVKASKEGIKIRK